MDEILKTITEAIVTYGPFPVGIVVGILLARFAYHDAMKYINEEKNSLREEKKQLRDTIEAQQQRIDLLHQQAYSQSDTGETP